MNKGELYQIEKRIEEIDSILDLCDSNWDSDIIDNLELELEQIIKILENSIKGDKKTVKIETLKNL